MKTVYIVAFALVDKENRTRGAMAILTGPENADENDIISTATSMLPADRVKQIIDATIETLNDDALRALGAVALAKGLV